MDGNIPGWHPEPQRDIPAASGLARLPRTHPLSLCGVEQGGLNSRQENPASGRQQQGPQPSHPIRKPQVQLLTASDTEGQCQKRDRNSRCRRSCYHTPSSAAAMRILEKILEIEKEITRMQKNKATEYHLGLLNAKLAKYRAQLLEPSKSTSSKGEGFDVMNSGDARVALIGFPSVGKSTFWSLMTSTASEAASYEFTTLTCVPGVVEYKGSNIQLLDLPGIIEGTAQGKGHGQQVIAVAHTADVIMMLDATKGEVQRSLLEKELESMGIRLNEHKPNIHFKPKKGGGNSFNSTATLTQCSEKIVQLILHEYEIFNAEVLFQEDCSPDEFIDVIMGNRISMEEVDSLTQKPNSVVTSCGMKLNLDYLLEMLWEYLALTCIYTKKRGQRTDFPDTTILQKGASVEHVCHRIHWSLTSQFQYALVWGTSTKYSPQ
ncbi:Developmentally-regulated GTP-binding protein 2 [Saguinus oedipus]|uniref:Developmentally-regulated GTP-binding protein 2 n=1 Tax=Saguinus oedipus TaxID=9490 RepID=A0ABQ9VS74_SAGOE|nr:Developmentally-regulated GTP-binding protein 2 [Saguinus oedipus]